MTTETTNVAPTTPAAAAPKEPTKMDRARVLYNQLKAADAEIPEGSSIRKEFISKAQASINLTKNGAITYYNNLQNEAKGNPLYIKPKKAATISEVQGAEAQVAQTVETKAGDAQADAALTGAEAETTDEEQQAE